MANITCKINGYEYTFQKGLTILDASFETLKFKKEYLNHPIPTLYYLKGIMDIDESGVCIAEADGEIVNASTTRVTDGMEIKTNTPAVIQARKDALAAILKRHNKACLHCMRSESCELQNLLRDYGFTDEQTLPMKDLEQLDTSSVVLVRDNNKCIRCKRCINVCAKRQAVSAITACGEGLDTLVTPSSPKGLAASSCVNCGQCVAVCPVGALTEADHTELVKAALDDPQKFVVVQTAPAVRAALGEDFEFPVGVDVEGRMAEALRRAGFDRVFDTKFGADLTIMEEANELVERVTTDGVLPMITSCCPGWIKYAEHFYPDMLDNISTCKSPHQMQGAMTMTANWWPTKKGIVLGFTTMGIIAMNFIYVPNMPKLLGGLGLGKGMTVVAILLAIVAVVTLIKVKNTPEEAGTYPDGDPNFNKSGGAEIIAQMKEYKSPFTLGKVCRDPSTWAIGIGSAFAFMAVMSYISSAITVMVAYGYDYTMCTLVFSVGGIFGIVGSFLFGVLDQKLGTKKSFIIYFICLLIGFLFLFPMQTSFAFCWISGIIIFAAQGALCNLLPSYVTTKYGRWDYTAGYRVIGTIFEIGAGVGVMLIGFFNVPKNMYIFDVIAIIVGLVLIILSKDKFVGKEG